MTLTVTREGKVVVRTPFHVSQQEIEVFVQRHKRWLSKRLAEREETLNLMDGASVSICGNIYQVATGEHARLAENTLYLPAEGREAALIALLRRIARMRMKSLLDRICAACGMHYAKMSVTSARSRWGSCSSKGNISFTFRTAFLPDALAEYLAVHELCHTLHMNHSRNFWHAVEGILPDFAARKKTLKGYLSAMNYL